jgi:hypothetical protein
MNNEIYTYFDASLGIPHQGEIFFHWHRSWKRHGWEPRLLHPRTWRSHPLRKKLKFIFDNPVIEPESKARVASLMAFDSLGKSVLYSDYDVVNFGLEPGEVTTSMATNPHIYACRAWGGFGIEGVRKMLEVLTELKRNINLAPSVPPLVEFDDPDWNVAPLVHFSRRVCKGVPKHLVVEACGRYY